ncbi:MAG: pyrroline-5-carboxylate reductase [Chloroflexi bacterium HGW-Chloroflexi-10]|nr:MAG: pyrroline-5-carboxylate reductase [Chloroflexi bacterium HGW-Chloroflexi-10]
MNSNTRFAVIGAGAMGEAIIAGLIRQNLTTPEHISASEPREDRGKLLREKYGINITSSNLIAITEADVVVLAVKPQILQKVLLELNGKIPPEAVVISIIAGATVDNIATGLRHTAIIRTMPNTPGQIGEGITVWYAAKSVNPTQMENGTLMLKALGANVQVEEEYYLDMATAVSGTGPMYVFLFMEAMMDAAVHLGFSRHIAEQLVIQTIRGSVDYYETQNVHVADLRNKVTSPGGTSAAALYYLEKAGFRTAISRAVWAAYERSQQLGKGKLEQHPEKNGD